MEPIIIKNPNYLGGTISSKDFNELIYTAMVDILNLSEEVSRINENIDKAIDVFNIERAFIRRRIIEIENKISDIISTQQNIQSGKNVRQKTFAMFDDSVNILSGIHDNFYDVYMPYINKKYSKFRFKNEINPQVKIKLYESLDKQMWVLKYNEVTDKNLFNIVDSKPNYYIRKSSTYDENLTEFYARLEIDMPTEYVNNLRANCIKLSSYPIYSFDLLSIEYKDQYGQWNLIPSYPTNNNFPIEINEVSNLMLFFNTIEALAYRVTIRVKNYLLQTDPISNTTIKTFVYGFFEFDAEYIEPVNGTSSFIVKFNLPDTNKYFDIVYYPEILLSDFSYKNPEYKCFLYTDDKLIQRFDFDVQLPIQTNTIYVKFDIQTNTNEVFAIKGVKFSFVTR